MSAQKRLKEHFEQLEENYNQLMAMADSLPEELAEIATPETVFFSNLKIAIPYDITALRQTRKLLGSQWKFGKCWGSANPEHTYQNYYYKHPDFDVHLEINMDLAKEGSTCRIEKIGEETKEVYKIVCS